VAFCTLHVKREVPPGEILVGMALRVMRGSWGEDWGEGEEEEPEEQFVFLVLPYS
jgi:hypothetical protein